MGSIACIAWKGDTLVLGDVDGNLNFWDLKARLSRLIFHSIIPCHPIDHYHNGFAFFNFRNFFRLYLHSLFETGNKSIAVYKRTKNCPTVIIIFDSFRGIPTHRGWVKKIRFAPGKGNQKLLVMYTDGAEVWDTKEVSPTVPKLLVGMLQC